MKCEQARSLMMAYLDGEPVDQEALADHIARCPECREAWERLRAVERLLREAPVASAPTGFAGRVLARVDRRRRVRRTVLGSLTLIIATAAGGILGLGAAVWSLSGLFQFLDLLLRAAPTLIPRLADVAGTLLRSLCLTVDALTAWLLLLAICGLVAAVAANWVWWRVVRRVQAAATAHP
ncbi:MAG TPA: hypothetical protein ENK08_11775 [Chloroflexi bacterium]|nr:hypothetical protein [Chloroflexota bacterium]